MIKVNQKVYDGLEAVRSSGETNMFSFDTVQYLVNKWEYYETVVWMEDHKEDYIKGIFEGFEVG